MRSLRTVAIASHALPVLLVAPIVSLALALLVETAVLMPGLAAGAAVRAALLREAALGEPEIWRDRAAARRFVAGAQAIAGGGVSLLGPDLAALAESGGAEGVALAVAPAAGEAVLVRTSYAWGAQQALAVARVSAADGRPLGFVAYAERAGGPGSAFAALRRLVGAALLVQLVLAGAAGAALALRLARPVAAAADAVDAIAAGGAPAPAPERGPAEIRRLLAAVNGLAARLAALEQQRRHALANLVHELGRPLGAVRAAIYVLRGPDGADEATRAELLAGIDDEVVRMQPLLEDLAQLHAQATGRSLPQREPLAVSDWLRGLAAIWRARAQERGIAFAAAVPDGLPALSADPAMLARAVGNLLSNALRYTPPGGAVSLEAGVGGGELWVAVADDGPGIEPGEQRRIFEPFERGGRRFPEGLGLGLSIARDLVAAHGGRIELASAPGAGSRFTIWLPLEGDGA